MKNHKEYIKNCYRTWNKEISFPRQIEHALLGIGDEIGEMHSAIKKVVGYGQEFNLVNFKEEVGDAMYFTFVLSDLVGVKLPEVVETTPTFSIRNYKGHLANLKLLSATLDVTPPSMMENLILDLHRSLYDIIDSMAWSPQEVAESNINKLRVRFPEKFDEVKSKEENRNRDEEAKALING
jgi:NTP pyrophosphatase (non-canonical NTP hydrolase)